MKTKPIIIVSGEPNSVFLEIFLKSLKFKIYKSPIILISSLKLLEFYMKKLNFKKRINLLDYKNLKVSKLSNKSINLIDINIKIKKKNKITQKSNIFIKKSFDLGLDIMKIFKSSKFINGPISKKTFLKKNIQELLNILRKKIILKNLLC